MTEKQWLFISALGLIVFNVVVISWGLDRFYNGSDNDRLIIMMSSVVTVPLLFATVFMNIIFFLCLIIPKHVQQKVTDFRPPHKIKKIWRIIDEVIDFLD